MKKAISLFLALMLCLSLAAPALAAETSGKYGDNVTWSYSNGTLTISGTGPMDNYTSITSIPWYAQHETITSVVIERGVTTIGEFTFVNCGSLTSVTIPNSVTSIGGYVFDGCGSLASVTIPDSVTAIGMSTFMRCGSLTSVTIPAGVTRIGPSAFFNCSSLTDVYYGGSESQWKEIDISNVVDDFGNNINAPLFAATIHYSNPAPSTPSTPAAEVAVTVNGKAVAWDDAEPFIDANGRTMVPLRAVADALGLYVRWNRDTRMAIFTDDAKGIWFPIDSKFAYVSDGGSIEMDTAAVIVNERSYAPARVLAEYFGCKVDWDDATRTVTITG